MKLIFETMDSIEAELVKGLLKSYEIETFPMGNDFDSIKGVLPYSDALIHIFVTEDDFEEASQILTELN
ncbi:MAG: DUF2007 domain-containing protein [Leptospira sp.]|jgi:hypothetical protein|nr:DUF2007 domain-containing protein [Leptospira sp.]NCS92605.1 DUF2007 domain-containing protein [Leptospira sp.]